MSKNEMTPQEAIKLLELNVSFAPSAINEYAVDVAKEALKKKIPHAPIKDTANLIDLIDFYCPCCGNRIVSKLDGKIIAGRLQKYCDECGQALNWGDTK